MAKEGRDDAGELIKVSKLYTKTKSFFADASKSGRFWARRLISPMPHREVAVACLEHFRINRGIDFPLMGLKHHQPIEMPLDFNEGIPRRYDLDRLPTISLVTPSYNQSEMLERTIQSVLSQKYPKLQYVIQDGGSTDDSVKVIKKYESQLHYWESRSDEGQSHAIEMGFKNTDGEIMAWLNSDDILIPGALWQMAHFFRKHRNVDVAFGHRVIIDQHDRKIGQWVLPSNTHHYLKYADYLAQESVFWNRRIWNRVGGIDRSFRFAMDWDLFLRFKSAYGKFKRIGKFIGAFRIHDAQKTSSQIADIGAREMDLLRKRELGRVPESTEISKKLVWLYWRNYLIERAMSRGFYRIPTDFVQASLDANAHPIA